MKGKQRLSASVDAEWLQAGHEAVAEGRAPNVSAWVNAALQLQAEQDRRLRALDAFIAAYEAEHGEITEADMEAAARRARAAATVVRGPGARAGTGGTAGTGSGPGPGAA